MHHVESKSMDMTGPAGLISNLEFSNWRKAADERELLDFVLPPGILGDYRSSRHQDEWGDERRDAVPCRVRRGWAWGRKIRMNEWEWRRPWTGGGSRDRFTRVHTCFLVGAFFSLLFCMPLVGYLGLKLYLMLQDVSTSEAGSSGRRDDAMYLWARTLG